MSKCWQCKKDYGVLTLDGICFDCRDQIGIGRPTEVVSLELVQSRRDRLAEIAYEGLVIKAPYDEPSESLAIKAYEHADAMIAQSKAKPDEPDAVDHTIVTDDVPGTLPNGTPPGCRPTEPQSVSSLIPGNTWGCGSQGGEGCGSIGGGEGKISRSPPIPGPRPEKKYTISDAQANTCDVQVNEGRTPSELIATGGLLVINNTVDMVTTEEGPLPSVGVCGDTPGPPDPPRPATRKDFA